MPNDERIGRMLRSSLPDVDWDQVERYLTDSSGDTPWPSFASGLLLGAAVGAIVAFALTPLDGRSMRRQMSGTARAVSARVPRRQSGLDETLIDAAEQAEVDLLRRLSSTEN